MRPAASAWYTSQYWEWGWLNAAAFREMHPYRPAKVKQIISFSPLCCISFLCQPTGNWKIPKLLNCLFRTDMSQSWNGLWKPSWRLDLLVRKDSNPSNSVFISAELEVRQWFFSKTTRMFLCLVHFHILIPWFAIHPTRHPFLPPANHCFTLPTFIYLALAT